MWPLTKKLCPTRGEERRQDFPISSLPFLPFFPSHPSIYISPLPSSFTPFFSHSVLDNPCIFNIAASSKLWTYSLAFRVLMKARRVLAPSLFPYTSSRLDTCQPLHIALSAPPLPPNLSEPLLPSYLFPFLVYSAQNSITGHTQKLKQRNVWER